MQLQISEETTTLLLIKPHYNILLRPNQLTRLVNFAVNSDSEKGSKNNRVHYGSRPGFLPHFLDVA
jgi:hypothetical protein